MLLSLTASSLCEGPENNICFISKRRKVKESCCVPVSISFFKIQFSIHHQNEHTRFWHLFLGHMVLWWHPSYKGGFFFCCWLATICYCPFSCLYQLISDPLHCICDVNLFFKPGIVFSFKWEKVSSAISYSSRTICFNSFDFNPNRFRNSTMILCAYPQYSIAGW